MQAENEAGGGRHAAEVQSLTTQLQAALEERNRLWADAQRARSLELEVEHTRRIIAEMQQSVSWRITTPLRGVKERAGVNRKLAGRVRRAVRGS